MIITPPLHVIARWRADSLAVVRDPTSPPSLRAWAWKFLTQWGAR